MKLKIGDKVKIVNYGHLVWVNKNVAPKEMIPTEDIYKEEDGIIWQDINPECIGEIGVISSISGSGYSLEGTSKSAWFNEEQLQKVEK